MAGMGELAFPLYGMNWMSENVQCLFFVQSLSLVLCRMEVNEVYEWNFFRFGLFRLRFVEADRKARSGWCAWKFTSDKIHHALPC